MIQAKKNWQSKILDIFEKIDSIKPFPISADFNI